MKRPNNSVNTILYLSTYPPRECGIATFTQDLTMAMDKRFNPVTKSRVVALNENPTSIYNYGPRAIGQIAADSLDHYVTLAQTINRRNDIKIVNIQHEFGIFGGSWGDFLIPFLQVIQKPVVTTFHSILPEPDEYLKSVVGFIANKSRAMIVLNSRSKNVLEEHYEIPKSKIYIIPHGIPETTFETTEKSKEQLGFKNKILLSTFGLISKDKGIEHAIRALPKIVKKFPNLLYLIIGETHPVVRREEGEIYRNFLNSEVERLRLNDHVKFYNKYLSLDELVTYLKATDIYIAPNANLRQSVSGTLSYALGCGRPAVCTPTEYAKYLINDQNGILVESENPESITRAVSKLLEDEKLRHNLNRGAYETTRHMIWPNVAAAYFRLFKKWADIYPEEKKLPEIKFDHLTRLTDNFGMFQHARYSKPLKRFGYSLDDNARALIACAKYYELDKKPEALRLIKIYLNFMKFAQRKNGNFANIISADKIRDKTKEEDTQGRALWALGYIASRDYLPKEIIVLADSMFQKTIKSGPSLKSPRAVAFAMTGLYHYLKHSHQKKLLNLFKKFAEQQLDLYKNTANGDWQWFEDQLTYSNSKLPESLFYGYDLTKNKKYLAVAQKSLNFLKQITFGKKHYSPIGQAGWYFRDKERSYFDQQPEDTAAMIETKIVAYKITGNKIHLEDALKAFNWFLGKNHLNLMVYDELTGGCHDGVGRNTLNLNEGAESSISYLMARLALEEPKIKNDL